MKILAGFRVTAGLTQEEVASALNITQTAVSQWECGRVKPTIDKIPLLAKLYNVAQEDILEECTNLSNNIIVTERKVNLNEQLSRESI